MNGDHQEDRIRGGCIGAVAMVVLLVLPIGYFLSCGPAVWLRDHGYISQQAILVVYAPLAWLDSTSPAAREWIEWYCQFWV